jgi:heme exporter protein B
MGSAQASWTVVAKEVRAEFRTRELLSTTVVFAMLVVVLFSFAFNPTPDESRRYGPGLLWIAFLFAGSLLLQPSFVREQANDTLSALRMAPVPPFSIVFGKILANFIFLSATEVVLVPIFLVLYNVSVSGVVMRLALVLALGTLGIVITGTVFSAVSAQARMRELLLPLLLFPILAPVLIGAVESTTALFREDPALDLTWVSVLAGFDIVFLTASWILCEYLLEE